MDFMAAEENKLDKTSVVDSDTLKVRLEEAGKRPPALILLMGPAGVMGKQWPLEKAELTVGRDPTCDIHVDEKSMSKRHALVRVKDDGVFIVDQGSTNGTEFHGQRLDPMKEAKLVDNDTVKLGNVIFKFVSSGIESFAAAHNYDRGTTDGLTGILNKSALLLSLEESFKKSRLTETNLSLIVFDLDHFKKINDTHGHQAGDFVLREVCTVVKNQLIRSGDTFGRYGGEEFVIILYGSPLQRACDVAERIRSTIEKHNFSFGGKTIPVTISLGVACLDSTMASASALFEKADQASYASKRAGRNRVSTL
ncbi:MAG: GGDEF domain-containing protein [Oligoflexia bacterium]|nr:GGDEF domain-containing protein [Oligoflexia bacterium]